MTPEHDRMRPFNSPLETGLRSVSMLVSGYPRRFDLQQLVAFDHLVVHTGDVGGPESLHAAVPMRTAELLIRRGMVERGLLLMASRGLVDRGVDETGIVYRASDFAQTFLDSLTSPYILSLKERADWVIQQFGDLNEDMLRERIGTFFDEWIEQFQVAHRSLAGEI